MKYLVFCLAFLSTSISYAQKLKLKKGQKFTFEYLTLSSSLSSTEDKYMNFDAYQFEVINTKAGIYNMKMQLLRKITYDSHDGRITDSQKPITSSQEKNIRDLMNKVLIESPFTFTMDTSGKVLDIKGLDEIKSAMISRAAIEKIPENRYGSPNAGFIEYGAQPAVFMRIAHLAFRQVNTTKTDTTFHRLVAEKADDTIKVNKEMIVDAKTGVTKFSYKDSLNYGNIPGKISKHRDQISWWFALKSASVAALKPSIDLLEQFSRQCDFKNYNTHAKIATRAVEDLKTWYGESKGKLGIDDIARQKLDSLSKLIKPDDYEFHAAAAEVLSYFDYDGKMKLIKDIPVEYLRRDATVVAKAKIEYKDRNKTGFVNALHTTFTKFASDGNFPLNVSHAADLVHFHICKDVFSDKTSRADLLKIHEMVKAVQALNNPNLSSLFDGIEPYIVARLAQTPEEIEVVINNRFKSVFDNYGRYRLLIYDRMTSLKVADSIRTAYLDYSMEMFRNDIAEFSKPFEGDRQEKYFHSSHIAPQRLVLRKQLADAYYRKSILDPKNKTKYLQLASDYLPTQEDQIEDKYIITHEYPYLPEQNYTEMYLNAAGATGISAEEMLKRYVDMVIVEPDRYAILKEKYLKAYPKGNFKTFFSQALKEKLPASPIFKLSDRKGMVVNNASSKGKFLFIDFWGTWCGACVDEIDKIEDLHVNNPVPNKLNVTTIACYDKESLVDEFMEKKKFTYQVLMSDAKVEKDFKVHAYPTKLLLLPNDVYLLIPFSDDYKSVVKKYTNWDL